MAGMIDPLQWVYAITFIVRLAGTINSDIKQSNQRSCASTFNNLKQNKYFRRHLESSSHVVLRASRVKQKVYNGNYLDSVKKLHHERLNKQEKMSLFHASNNPSSLKTMQIIVSRQVDFQ